MMPVELLVPYSEGARLHDLHEVAGKVEREDGPDGVLVKTRLPMGEMPPVRRSGHRLAPDPSSRPGNVAPMKLNFQILTEGATLPTRAHEGDAGLDLYASEAAHIGPGERWQVAHRGRGRDPRGPRRTGRCRAPAWPSGTASRVVNAPGLIDAGYRGELKVLLLNNDPAEVFRIAPGDRIAQLVITPVVVGEPVEAETLSASERGEGGFGSTGR